MLHRFKQGACLFRGPENLNKGTEETKASKNKESIQVIAGTTSGIAVSKHDLPQATDGVVHRPGILLPPSDVDRRRSNNFKGAVHVQFADECIKEVPKHYSMANHPVVGEGSYGHVVRALDKRSGEVVAIKFITKSKGLSKMMAREIISHRVCSAHPHVIAFREAFETSKHLAVVMDYARGGDLFEYCKEQGGSLCEDNARVIFQQIASAVAFCHKMGVAIRDLKMENTLIHSYEGYPLIKLCDFGYSKSQYNDSLCKTAAGTIEYAAPEVLMGANSYDGKATDVWSLGVLLFAMLNGSYPFHRRRGDQQSMTRMLRCKLTWDIEVSSSCEHLVRGMLTAKADKRFHIEQVLSHPWVKKDMLPHLVKLNKSPPSPRRFSQTDEDIHQLVARVLSKP